MELTSLELIAIHIKKTAGMSFKHLLKGEYGKEYYRMNISQDIQNRTEVFNQHLAEIPAETRVIHGHFLYADALPLYKAFPQVPVVTWLRDPVQRVVSSYYFAKRKYSDGDQLHKTYMEHYSLLEYAEDTRFRNEMSRVLEGSDLAGLAFVGLLEHLVEDVAYLAALLGWGAYQIPERNVNISYKAQHEPPTEAEKKEITRLNKDDVELYRLALELRKKRQPTAKL